MPSPDGGAKRPLHQRVAERLFADPPKEHGARAAAAGMGARKIYVNCDVPEAELAGHAAHYCTNAITTAQYTLLTFLPVNLARQFRRVANIYFLVLTILQLIPYFAVGSAFLTVAPILLVLAITAAKDAFEDWRRHITDRHFNETPTRLVRNLRNANLLWQDTLSQAATTNALLSLRIRFARQLKRRTRHNQVPHHWEEAENPVDPATPPVLIEDAKWRNVRIGDFVILRTGDPAPADILILATSADDNSCYVETKNLDGETNLKPRTAVAETAGVRDPAGCARLRAIVEADPPSSNMTKFNGSVRIFSAPAVPGADDSPAPSSAVGSAPPLSFPPQSPLSPRGPPPPGPRAPPHRSTASSDSYEMRLLGQHRQQPFRQSPLAQSAAQKHLDDSEDAPPSYDLDTAVPTSNDCSLGKSLPSDVDYGTDPAIIPFTISNVLLRGMTVRNTDWLVGLVMYTGDQTKIVLNSGPSPYKRSRIERVMNVQVFISFGMVFALSFVVAVIGGQRYASSNQRSSPYLNSSSSTGLYGLALFWSAMIMLQNIIPIALYVSIEFVKSWHAYWIYEDIDMYYEPTDQRCVARNWNISDDLGQVSYIFSDKTGTLTRNVMDFRMCSINGVIYGKQLPGDELDVVKGRMAQEEVDRNNPPEGGANPFFMEIQDDEDRAATAVAAGFDGSLQSPVVRRMGDNGVSLEEGRLSISSSIASNGTDQCDNSPLITTSVVSGRSKTYAPLPAPAPAPLPIDAARSRARTEQSMSDEEIQAKRKRMIHTYLSAMRGVFDPVYVEVGDEETGEGGSYTFVDPQIFYDMRPEVAPAGRVKGMASPRADAAARVEGSGGSGPDGAGLGLAVPFEPVRRIASHRSVHHGFDVDPLRQRDAIDLFLTQVATCHSVVVEKSFQKQIIDDDRDDRSTIRRLARIFHGRSGSRKITERVLHMRNRSRQHRRTESAATASSFGGGGDDVEWAPPDNGPMSAGHARNASMAVGGSLRMADGGPSPPRHARNMSLMDAASYSATAPARRGSGLVTDVRTSFPGAPRSAESGEVPGFFDAPLSGEPATHSPLSAHSRSQSPVPLHMQATAEGDALAGSQLMSPEGHTPQKDMSRLAYSAESPDEGALVRAAKNLGYTFLGRVKGTLYVDVRGEQRQYEVLDTIEFDSTRKRMSTVMRRPAPHNDIILFTKGADNVMIERLCAVPERSEHPGLFGTHDEVAFERTMRERTFTQIDEFANAGLRTLLLGYRTLTENEWVRWSARYHAAQASLDSDRDERIAAVCAEMERDLRIAGATAIEDKLQERVPETIASLRAAGIRIWVLTGDKMETAINIGFAANLLTKEMELWTISSASGTANILSRFRLIARIMRSMGTATAPEKPKLGLDVDDARALGSVSYKIGRARKFLNIGETLRQRRQRKARPAAATAVVSPTAPPPTESKDDDLSPDEVRKSIEYLRRHSSTVGEGLAPEDAAGGAHDPACQPLNALVIDGGALSIVMGDAECRAMLLEIAPLFKSVVCCRASPLQKAEVVSLIKDGLDLVTLAIGDGANDVSMIQTADIGVAISGEEGLQAAMASDYTVGRFHFLQNLLLVHGLFDYLRMSEMILSFFYKNVIWAMVPFWFGIYCSFSANVFYDLSYIQMYNVVFTVAPVVLLGCVDKPFNYRTAMTYVAVYTDGIHNRYFQWWRYFMYVLDGIYQSAVIFFAFYLFTYESDLASSTGRTWGRADLSTGPTVAVVIAASLCVGFNSWQWNWMMAVAIALSILVCLLYVVLASLVRYSSIEGVGAAVMSTVVFWFGVAIAVVAALLPRFAVRGWQKMYRPQDLDIIREIKVLHRPWYGQVFVDPASDQPSPPSGKGHKHARFQD